MNERDLLARLDQLQLDIALGLCKAPVDSFEKYREQVGRFTGLEQAKQLLLSSEEIEK